MPRHHILAQVVELHNKSGKRLQKGEGVCIIDSDISCDFDEERPGPVASSAPAAVVSGHLLSAAERKLVAVSSDDEGDAGSSCPSVFVGTGRRIKGGSGAAAFSGGGGAAVADSRSSPATEVPALSWTLQFHWYEGQQDSVPSNPASVKAAVSRTSSVSSEATSRTKSEATPRTKSGGSTSSEACDDPFQGSPHSLKHKKP